MLQQAFFGGVFFGVALSGTAAFGVVFAIQAGVTTPLRVALWLTVGTRFAIVYVDEDDRPTFVGQGDSRKSLKPLVAALRAAADLIGGPRG